MAFANRRMDRAQRTRARRVWWERHGAFVRGWVAGTVVTIGIVAACMALGVL